MSMNIGLDHLQRHGTTTMLTTLLADQFLLSLKALKGHWNVAGPTFNDLHEFLWRHHASLNSMMEWVAGRIRAIGSNVPGTMAEFMSAAELKEHPETYPDMRSLLEDLMTDHELVAVRLRDDARRCTELCNDAGSADLLGFMSRRHEELAWVIRTELAQHESTARMTSNSRAGAIAEGTISMRVVL